MKSNLLAPWRNLPQAAAQAKAASRSGLPERRGATVSPAVENVVESSSLYLVNVVY